MSNPQNPNLEMLMLAVDQLGDLAEEMVFLGGCATGLLVTDQAAPPFRPTDDVDAIVQLISVAEYFQFSKKLRDRNFREDTRDDAPVCKSCGTECTSLSDDPRMGELSILANRLGKARLEYQARINALENLTREVKKDWGNWTHKKND